MPFINALGYNVFDPREVIPEFTADVGIKKGEKLTQTIASKDDVGTTSEQEPESAREIVTTESEIEGFYVVKSIVREVVDPSRVFMRDTLSYCGVLLDDNNRKPVCRLFYALAGHRLVISKAFRRKKGTQLFSVPNASRALGFPEKSCVPFFRPPSE